MLQRPSTPVLTASSESSSSRDLAAEYGLEILKLVPGAAAVEISLTSLGIVSTTSTSACGNAVGGSMIPNAPVPHLDHFGSMSKNSFGIDKTRPICRLRYGLASRPVLVVVKEILTDPRIPLVRGLVRGQQS